MESIYKDKVEAIINSGDSVYKINNKLTNLIEESNHDGYVIYMTAEYRIENKLRRYKKLLDELVYIDEYYQYANYTLAQIPLNEKNYVKVLDYLSKIIYQKGNYADKARKLYAQILFKKEMYDELLKLLEYTSLKGLENESIYFYSAKVYMIRENTKEAINCLKEAVRIEPDNIAFHDKLRHLYYDMGYRADELKEIDKLIELGSNNKEVILRSKLACLNSLHRSHELIEAIKEAKKFGIENSKNDDQLFALLFKYSDYDGVEEMSKEIISKGNMNIQKYSDLMRMYNIETLYDKSLNLYEKLKPASEKNIALLYAKANIHLQKGEYKKAKDIIFQLINRSPKSTVFARFLALCLFLENKYDEARKVMQLIEPETTKLDIYLRHELCILDYHIFKEKPFLIKLLENYNYEDVRNDIEHRFIGSMKDIRFNDDIDVRKFTDDMHYIVSNVKPNYTLDKDVYLIDYGKEVASIHGKQTGHFIVDALPGGKLVTYRPVIATQDAVNENKYTRVRS